ncbi:hypothetical protein U5801_23665, partial [Lamprobacter modestohalophilus]|uniref:hypothetical protein n=1 Tax=Lamprobacter modestohalophilus TaxID=1064514 RepID=UPI002ADEF744
MGFFDFLSARRKQPGIQPSAEVTLEHAEERLASGDYTKAEQDYQQLRNALPDEPKAWIGYALAAQRDKRWIDALERWQAAAGRFTDIF